MVVEMAVSNKEIEIYDNFAVSLAQGVDVVDRKTYEVIIDSRRKDLLRCWLKGKKGLFLDFGCGDGAFSRFIKNDLKNDVIGVDLSGGIVKFASEKCEDIEYLAVDCHNLPFVENSFDAIIAVGIFHHLNLKKAIVSCKQLLKKNGVIVVFEPNSLCPLSFIGRRFFKTKIHTPDEKPYNYWSFVDELEKNGFAKVELRFLSFFGFIFPFIWVSKFAPYFFFLKKFVGIYVMVDCFFEKLPLLKQLCWQFCCKCEVL